jgi:hypothetical protein
MRELRERSMQPNAAARIYYVKRANDAPIAARAGNCLRDECACRFAVRMGIALAGTANTTAATQRRCRTEFVGNERSPVLIIDDFFDSPEALVDQAGTCAFQPVTDKYYPGVRARAPNSYIETVVARTDGLIREAFGLGGKWLAGADFDFSMVTTPPAELHLLQRLPHFDATDMCQIAVLHYLCTLDNGGTSFYRHRGTGFETITLERRDRYLKALDADLKALGMPDQVYIGGDTKIFERIGGVEAAFNRLVVYRGAVLHSGDIPRDFGFAHDVRAGRLTVNTFLYYR